MNKLKKTASINLIISYSAIFIGFFNTIYRTQLLSTEQIGLIAIIFSISGILMFFVQSAFTNVIIKYVGRFKHIAKKKGLIIFIFIVSLSLFILVTILFFLFKTVILKQYDNYLLDKYINFIIFLLFVQSFFNLIDVSLRSFFYPNFPTFLKYTVQRILHTILLFTALFGNLSFHLYFILLMVIYAINLVLIFFYFLKIVGFQSPDFSFLNIKFLKEMFTYGIFMSFGNFVNIFANRIDKIMLGIYTGLSLTGVYAIGILFGNILGRIGEAVIKIYHPKVSKDLSRGLHSAVAKDYKEVGKFQVFLGMFLFTFFTFFSEKILFLLDEKYAQGFWVVIIMAFGQLINNATSICGGIISYSRYYRFDFIIKFVMLIMNVVLNIILIPKYELIGAVIATSSALIFYNVCKLIFVYWKFRIQPFSKAILKIIVANFIIALAFYVMTNYYLPSNLIYISLIGLISFIIYNFLLYSLSFFTVDEINIIKKRFVK